jgi:hypothetical protein
VTGDGDSGRGGRFAVGATAKQVAEHASAITRLELELVALEMKRKAATIGVGAGLAAGAALLAVFAVGFLFATIAAGIATVAPVWLALLIVTVVLLLVIALLGFLAKRAFEKATPAMPEEAIGEARLTMEAIRP